MLRDSVILTNNSSYKVARALIGAARGRSAPSPDGLCARWLRLCCAAGQPSQVQRPMWCQQRAEAHPTEAIRNDLDATIILVPDDEIQVAEEDVGTDCRSCFSAHTGGCSCKRDGPGP